MRRKWIGFRFWDWIVCSNNDSFGLPERSCLDGQDWLAIHYGWGSQTSQVFESRGKLVQGRVKAAVCSPGLHLYQRQERLCSIYHSKHGRGAGSLSDASAGLPKPCYLKITIANHFQFCDQNTEVDHNHCFFTLQGLGNPAEIFAGLPALPGGQLFNWVVDWSLCSPGGSMIPGILSLPSFPSPALRGKRQGFSGWGVAVSQSKKLHYGVAIWYCRCMELREIMHGNGKCSVHCHWKYLSAVFIFPLLGGNPWNQNWIHQWERCQTHSHILTWGC